MTWQARGAAAFGVAALASTGNAIVAFSNFGPEYAYDLQSGWTVSGPTSDFPTQVVAFQFTALASGLVTDVKIPLGHVAGTNIGQVILYNDSGTNTIGNRRATWTQSLAEFGSPDLLNLVNTDQSLILVAGAKYWLGTHYVVDDTWDAWNFTTLTDEQFAGFSYDGGDTYDYGMQLPAGAFEVNVVPEPTSLVALGAGFGLAAIRRRRRSIDQPEIQQN